MYKNAFVGRALPGPAGELTYLPSSWTVTEKKERDKKAEKEEGGKEEGKDKGMVSNPL